MCGKSWGDSIPGGSLPVRQRGSRWQRSGGHSSLQLPSRAVQVSVLILYCGILPRPARSVGRSVGRSVEPRPSGYGSPHPLPIPGLEQHTPMWCWHSKNRALTVDPRHPDIGTESSLVLRKAQCTTMLAWSRGDWVRYGKQPERFGGHPPSLPHLKASSAPIDLSTVGPSRKKRSLFERASDIPKGSEANGEKDGA